MYSAQVSLCLSGLPASGFRLRCPAQKGSRGPLFLTALWLLQPLASGLNEAALISWCWLPVSKWICAEWPLAPSGLPSPLARRILSYRKWQILLKPWFVMEKNEVGGIMNSLPSSICWGGNWIVGSPNIDIPQEIMWSEDLYDIIGIISCSPLPSLFLFLKHESITSWLPGTVLEITRWITLSFP